MVFAILSDIHANLEALRAVWTELDRRVAPDARTVVCLGDMVGYGAEPDAVVAFLRERRVLAVQGNHEYALARPAARRAFNPVSLMALEWTDRHVAPETREWLAAKPLSLSLGGCRFVHGFPPQSPLIYLHEVDRQRLERALTNLSETVCFVGHTHLLRRVRLGPQGLVHARLCPGSVLLEPDSRHLVNAGAVGQPRDSDARAGFVLYDPQSARLEAIRIPYDWRAAADKILAAGLPEVYAARLDPDTP